MADADIQSLRLFLSMVNLRNLTHAAHRHNISPSAVTKRIRDLEAFYRVPLFERQSRGVLPTAAGEELAVKVRDLFAQLDRIKATMSEFSEGARGQVRVHASASILLEALIDLIVSFTADHPLIRIELAELMSWAIVRDVAEGRADIGLVAGSVELPSDLVVMPFRRDRLMAIIPVQHDLSGRASVPFEELLDYDHVGIGVTSAISIQLAEEAARLHRSIRYSYRVATYDVARVMVARGCGMAVLPSSLVSLYADTIGIKCVPLSDQWAVRDMRICTRDVESLTVGSRLFIDHIRSRDGDTADPRGLN